MKYQFTIIERNVERCLKIVWETAINFVKANSINGITVTDLGSTSGVHVVIMLVK